MNTEPSNDAPRTPQAEQPPTRIQELLSIQRDLQKLTERLGAMGSIMTCATTSKAMVAQGSAKC